MELNWIKVKDLKPTKDDATILVLSKNSIYWLNTFDCWEEVSPHKNIYWCKLPAPIDVEIEFMNKR